MTDMVECLRKQGRHDIADEIERLRARIAELETAAAITFGTLAQPTDDEPAIITHDIPPNAPR
jgi:hypothetical protein